MSDRLIGYPFFQEAYGGNGCRTEIHGDPPRALGRFAEMKRVHERWRSGDRIYMAS